MKTILRAFTLLSLALALPALVSAQTVANEYYFTKRNATNTANQQVKVTPVNGRVLGFNSLLEPVMVELTLPGDAAADGSTKGLAAFAAADFNAAAGVISIDYANAQKASGSQHGLLSSSDWTTFNAKEPAITTLPISKGGTGGTTQATALSALGALFGNFSVKAGSWTVTAADRGTLFLADNSAASGTVTIPSPSTLGAGFVFGIVRTDFSDNFLVIGDTSYYAGNDAFLLVHSDGISWRIIPLLLRQGSFVSPASGAMVINIADDLMLNDAANVTALDWTSRQLYDQDGMLAVDWHNRKFVAEDSDWALYSVGYDRDVVRFPMVSGDGTVDLFDGANDDWLTVAAADGSLKINAGSAQMFFKPSAAGAMFADAVPGEGLFTLRVAVPSSSTSAGEPGMWASDATHLYVCHATNTWRRVAVSSW